MIIKDILIKGTMQEIRALPDCWAEKWQPEEQGEEGEEEDENYTLEEWMEALYFDEGRSPEFTWEEWASWATILSMMMMRFEPDEQHRLLAC